MKYSLFFLLLAFTFNICCSFKLKDLTTFCNPSHEFIIEPASNVFRDSTKTFGLTNSFFLGTGAEFHSKGNGKWPMLNLIVRERWCVDKDKGIIQNNMNGLFLLRSCVSPGCVTMVSLRTNVDYGYGWEFKKIKGSQYYILAKKIIRDTVQKALQVYLDETINAYRVSTFDFDEKNAFQVWNLIPGN